MPPIDALQPGSAAQTSAPSTTESTNAVQLTQVLGKLVDGLSSSGDDVVAQIEAITTAVTASLIGGQTGSTANKALVSKGTGARALQPTVVSIDPATGNINTNGGDLTVDDITADVIGASTGNITTVNATDVNSTNGTFSSALTKGGTSVAIVTQTYPWSWYFLTATAKDYKLIINCPIACTINTVTTFCESGSCTLTGKINSTALGGSANSVSPSEVTQTHTTSNTMAVGDDFVLTPSSISSLIGMTVTVKITVALA